MKKNYFAILALAAALVGCTEAGGDDEGPKSVGFITIQPVIETRATEVVFEEGDQIGLSVMANNNETVIVENEAVAFDGTVFESAVKWYTDADVASDIYAYYPYAAAIATFSVAEDQSAEGAYTASDLMGGVSKGVTPVVPTTVFFKHLLSQIAVSIKNSSDLEVKAVKIDGTIPTASFDAQAMSVSLDESASPIEITALPMGDGIYKAIVVPQVATITVNIELSNGSTESITIDAVEFKASGEYPTDIVIGSDGSIFVEQDDYFMYHGQKYNLVTLSNGAKWMAEPMSYLPEGKEASSDPKATAGVWYPYGFEGTTLTVLTDEASIKAKGYFYDQETAFGAKITEDNFDTFEGIQGICPDGWHIPTHADYFALIGVSAKVGATGAAIADDPNALFYDDAATIGGGSIAKANAAGWNYVFTGVRMQALFTTNPMYMATRTMDSNCSVADYLGLPSLSYYMSSTAHAVSKKDDVITNIQFMGVMSSFTSKYLEGRLSLSYTGMKSGQALRCVKDSE